MEATQFLHVSPHLRFLLPNPIHGNTTKHQIPQFRCSVATPELVSRNFNQKHPRKLFFRNRPKQRPKPFKEKDAFPESLPLHSRNPRAIYKDIQRLARTNKLPQALAVMDYVEQEGIPVNVTTLSALIAACIRLKSLTEARQVHAHIRIHELEGNEFLKNKLVHMYTACGSIDDARKVFDECPSSNVYSWNALIRGTVISGKKRYGDVVSAYGEMREMGIEPNEYTYCNVIKSFAGASAIKQGLKTHAMLVKSGWIGSSILRTGLVDMYFKCGRMKLAHAVFEEMSEKDDILWGAMIAGFAHNRRQLEALDYVRWMVDEGTFPNLVILTTILPVIGVVQARRIGQEVHGLILKTITLSSQITLQTGLIDMYCKCGDLTSGRSVFYGSKNRNVISWTALMSGYVSNGRFEQALRSVVWMQQEGFKPDVVTVVTVLPVCGKLLALKQGKEIHSYAVRRCFFPNVSVTTSLIKMYTDCGVLDYSIKLFDATERRNAISWTTMLNSYVEKGFIDEAFQLFRSMLLSKSRPDSVTLSTILTACAECKASKLGKEIHGQLLKKKLVPVPFVSAGIIRMYGSCGLIQYARSAFDSVPSKGSRTWTAIIEAHGYNNLYEDAISLFNEMTSRGCTPTQFTFNVVLSICGRAGFTDDACQIFDLMTRKYDLTVSEEHCSILVGLLNSCGRSAEGERYSKMMV
ncbi:Pentatricopeptide repeat-containing protein At1g71460, chloroplastic [Linum perenne]